MQRFVRLLKNTSLKSQVLYRNSFTKNIPETSGPNQFKPEFIQQLYGINLDGHILTKQQLLMPKDQYKFYQKNSPNYLVALIQKTLKNAQAHDIQDGAAPKPEFYQTCAYCSVKYLPGDKIELTKMHRVKLQSFQTISVSQQANQDQSQEQVQDQTEPQPAEPEENIRNIKQKKTIKQTFEKLLRKSSSDPLSEKLLKNYYRVKVELIKQPPQQKTANLKVKLLFLSDTISNSYKKVQNHVQQLLPNFSEIEQSNLDDIASCQINRSTKEDIQNYLEANTTQQRIGYLIQLITKNTHFTKFLTEVQDEAKVAIRVRKYLQFYLEMLRVAKQYLHQGKKPKQLFIQKCLKSFKSMNPSQEITDIFTEQIEKYGHIDQNSMEEGLTKNYIEELSKIPYNVQSEEVFDLESAQKIMDEEHFGMKDVKDAILEIIAVGKLKQSLKGKVFCFIGGPGIGKTSFAKSVAKALNRKFFSISLGGATDSSVLKGHRRTYQGAYSGKIIEALKTCGTSNPVILLDEIDKMGSSYHGDPRSELLQILDPNQNSSFVDNYIDIPVDLSNVLFITSANYEQNISKPLLDRMEKIYLTSYALFEKIAIFNKHLLPRAIQKTGVKADQFSLPAEVIETLVEEYSLGQPGVRYLQKLSLQLLQKIAYKIVTNQQQVPIKITKQNLHKYLGHPYFRTKDHTKLEKGVAISLGGGNYGRLTYIQAFRKSYMRRKDVGKAMIYTGSLGNVLKQAMSISYTFARNYLLEVHGNKYLQQNQVHVHAPEGASKKDGSTDSLTIVTALVSLALSAKVKPGIAMTGEVTLNGYILRSHNIKQKIMVASRQKITQVILPKQNKPDVDNLQPQIKKNIIFHYVHRFQDAMPFLFPEIAKQQLSTQVSA